MADDSIEREQCDFIEIARTSTGTTFRVKMYRHDRADSIDTIRLLAQSQYDLLEARYPKKEKP